MHLKQSWNKKASLKRSMSKHGRHNTMKKTQRYKSQMKFRTILTGTSKTSRKEEMLSKSPVNEFLYHILHQSGIKVTTAKNMKNMKI
jgi:hypothetical protein